MSTYEVWNYLHLLMFVFWVGTDMGVFLSAKKATDSSLSFESRMMLLHVALRIELIPRTMWKMALPLGVMLSVRLDLLDISSAGIALVWIFTIAWWILSMSAGYLYDKPVGHRLTMINNWVTGLVGVALVVACLTSAAGNGPFDASAGWLYWKVGCYGLINLTIVLMLYVFDPMGLAFVRLATEGSSDELEQHITSIWNRSAVTIWVTYSLILIVAFLGTTKPL